MAMSIKGEVLLPAEKAVVWAKLNDPAVLVACIPGCESLEQTSRTTFAVLARMKIGPVRATFRGQIALSNIDPPNGYRILGEGAGGLAGFAKGGADVVLTAAEGGTLLSYDVTAHVGGKLAQLGSRLIGGVAKRTADTFFSKFAAAVQGEAAGAVRERA